jgi:hypothetical protein
MVLRHCLHGPLTAKMLTNAEQLCACACSCVILGLWLLQPVLTLLPTLSLLPVSAKGISIAFLSAFQALNQVSVNFAFSTGAEPLCP